jgi:hypothetical protein
MGSKKNAAIHKIIIDNMFERILRRRSLVVESICTEHMQMCALETFT